MNDNETIAGRVPAEVFHVTECIADEMEGRGWTREVLATLLLVERHKDEWGKCKLELDLWFVVGPTTKKILFKEEFAKELAAIFDMSPDFFLNVHAAWMRHGRVAESDTAETTHESTECGEAPHHSVPTPKEGEQ